MSAVSEMLRAACACSEAITWAEAYDDPTEAWYACTDAQWMLWWVDHCGATPQRHELIADFALDCLAIYESVYPGDTRVRECIEARRAYARGEITRDQWEAARSAVWDSAMDGSWDVSRSASWAAAWAAARAAARAEARDVSWAAAMDAAWSAAWDAAARDASRHAVWYEVRDAALERKRLIILRHYPTPPTREGAR